MKENRPDVIQILENEREWHLEQIKRINIALAALTHETNEIKEGKTLSRQIAWSSEISKLFVDHKELSFNEIRNKLSERGIVEALEARYKSTIYATILRKMGKELEEVKNLKQTYRRLEKSEEDSKTKSSSDW